MPADPSPSLLRVFPKCHLPVFCELSLLSLHNPINHSFPQFSSSPQLSPSQQPLFCCLLVSLCHGSASCTSYLAPWMENGVFIPPYCPASYVAHHQGSKIFNLYFSTSLKTWCQYFLKQLLRGPRRSEERNLGPDRFEFKSKLCWVLVPGWLLFQASLSSFVKWR